MHDMHKLHITQHQLVETDRNLVSVSVMAQKLAIF